MYNIFWKEIAEAHENNKIERVHILFKKVCRFLFMAGSIISCYFIFWVEEIIEFALGRSYAEGTQAVLIMFFYPVHQCFGQINEAMLLAYKNTKTLMFLRVITISTGLLVSYFVMAPKDALVPGLDAGSTGLALKTVILQVIFVNLGIWWISKNHDWEYDWSYQVTALTSMLILGYSAYVITNGFANIFSFNLFWKLALDLLVFILFVGLYLWKFPSQAGLDPEELKSYLLRCVKAFRN